ncbi:hypothetical protein QIH96_05285 [Bradyrhizobium japonicum]|uniref:hypothetical protein n=1 Tax=Bradyrhizobium japonicum TaxID=375 RepID=UPI0027154557|nr:hypothetical protein [Bradyrhizobium japonicum]WLB64659.1 hypothetical protein QIH96_05285 [Bradyrhizobium japonicum]
MPKCSEGKVFGAGIFVLALWLFVGLPLYYGAGNAHSQSHQVAEQTANSSTAKPDGSEAAPLFVQIKPTPKTAAERVQEDEEREEKRSGDRWLVRWTAALFIATVGLIFATLVLGYFGYLQSRDMKHSIGVAQKSADAAMLSAQAAVAIQLPIIRITPEKLSHGDGHTGGQTFEECSVDAVLLSNLGPTKAFPVEILHGWAIGNELPPEPNYRFIDAFNANFILEPDPKTTPRKRLTLAMPLEPGQWPEILKGNYLWFYCSLHYDDFMGTRHSHGFCWRWANVGMGLAWRVDDTPAYNRRT